MKGYVYILKSLKNSRLYIGSSEDPIRRLVEFHNLGKVKATKFIMPLELVFKQEFESMTLARKAEYWIKRQKDKKFLQNLIFEGVFLKKFS